MSFVTRATIQGGPAAGSFSSAMLLAAVRIQGNTMFRRGQYTKRLSVDEEHGQISKASRKPAASQHQACQGCASFSDNSTARPLTARDVQTAAATLARHPGLVQFGRRFAISMGSHLSPWHIAEATAITHPSAENPPRQRCLSVLPFSRQSKSRTQRLLMLSDPSLLFAVAGAPRTPSYDFTCKAFIDGCSHSPSRLAVSRVADSAPGFCATLVPEAFRGLEHTSPANTFPGTSIHFNLFLRCILVSNSGRHIEFPDYRRLSKAAKFREFRSASFGSPR